MKSWVKWTGGWIFQDNAEYKPMPALVDLVEQAKQEWLYAKSYYNQVTDQDLIEYAVYLIKAYEKRYIYLLKMARQEGVVADTGCYIIDYRK
jgi:hypothetical protein